MPNEESVNVKSHLSLLGKKVKDRVTGFTGIVSSISFDLYGCIQAIINPGVDEKGAPKENFWFDVRRLEVIENEPVMEPPNFEFGRVAEGRSGAAEKPANLKV